MLCRSTDQIPSDLVYLESLFSECIKEQVILWTNLSVFTTKQHPAQREILFQCVSEPTERNQVTGWVSWSLGGTSDQLRELALQRTAFILSRVGFQSQEALHFRRGKLRARSPDSVCY